MYPLCSLTSRGTHHITAAPPPPNRHQPHTHASHNTPHTTHKPPTYNTHRPNTPQNNTAPPDLEILRTQPIPPIRIHPYAPMPH